jgi:hypothetical protein
MLGAPNSRSSPICGDHRISGDPTHLAALLRVVLEYPERIPIGHDSAAKPVAVQSAASQTAAWGPGGRPAPRAGRGAMVPSLSGDQVG